MYMYMYIHSGNDCKSTVCLSVRYTDAVRFEDAELLLLFDSASRAEEWKMVRFIHTYRRA